MHFFSGTNISSFLNNWHHLKRIDDFVIIIWKFEYKNILYRLYIYEECIILYIYMRNRMHKWSFKVFKWYWSLSWLPKYHKLQKVFARSWACLCGRWNFWTYTIYFYWIVIEDACVACNTKDGIIDQEYLSKQIQFFAVFQVSCLFQAEGSL